MKKWIAGILISLQAVVCFAEPLPQRQRRLAIFHLSQTESGSKQIQNIGGEAKLHQLIIFGQPQKFSGKSLFEMIDHPEGIKILINSKLLEASPIYLSWVVSQSLPNYRWFIYSQSLGPDMPYFSDISLWTHFHAMKHWQGLGFPNEYDYSYHANPDFSRVARELLASTTQHSEVLNRSKNRYEDFLLKRHKLLNYDDISIETYLSSQVPETLKKLARELKAWIENEKTKAL